MAFYTAMGSIPPKRHTQHRRPKNAPPTGGVGTGTGDLYHEELMGEEGFSSDSSLLYHRHIPATVVGVREWVYSKRDAKATAKHIVDPWARDNAAPAARSAA